MFCDGLGNPYLQCKCIHVVSAWLACYSVKPLNQDTIGTEVSWLVRCPDFRGWKYTCPVVEVSHQRACSVLISEVSWFQGWRIHRHGTSEGLPPLVHVILLLNAKQMMFQPPFLLASFSRRILSLANFSNEAVSQVLLKSSLVPSWGRRRWFRGEGGGSRVTLWSKRVYVRCSPPLLLCWK